MDNDYALYQQYQADRKQKQQYLVDNIQNMGYDAADFAHYLGWQRGKYQTTILDADVLNRFLWLRRGNEHRQLEHGRPDAVRAGLLRLLSAAVATGRAVVLSGVASGRRGPLQRRTARCEDAEYRSHEYGDECSRQRQQHELVHSPATIIWRILPTGSQQE